MDRIADVAAPEAALAIPRLEDGFVNMQELLRQLAESVVNEIMSAEADQLCEAMEWQPGVLLRGLPLLELPTRTGGIPLRGNRQVRRGVARLR